MTWAVVKYIRACAFEEIFVSASVAKLNDINILLSPFFRAVKNENGKTPTINKVLVIIQHHHNSHIYT